MTIPAPPAKLGPVMEKGIHIRHLPRMNHPVLIAGFDGWGNALNVSEGMVAYLIRKLRAESFADLNPDLYFRYDSNRPIVEIETGEITAISLPEGSFYWASTAEGRGDILILKSHEPNLNWRHFAGELMAFCRELGVRMIITLGGMYDNVLHSDRFMSGIASDETLSALLKNKGLAPITYKGPSAIHSVLLTEGKKMGYDCLSIWCHCPYYLEGITHFGLLAHLGSLLASLGDFELDTSDMEKQWKELNLQIQDLIEKNPQLQEMLSEIRKEKVKGSRKNMRESSEKGQKIINLTDFIKPRA
ncbi:MAG: PAC2 family protein [Deltaproteobacteria bacterium]